MKLESPRNAKKILLHTCCAPCSSAVIECLLQNEIVPTVYYFNPNIFPHEEYLKRKDECIRYCKMQSIDFVDADYNHSQWLQHVAGLENEPERGNRCYKCFAYRLQKTVQYAENHGFELIASTLASSRWKNLEQINQAGQVATQNSNVTFWEQNWRKGGLQERRNQIIKEQNFYNQTFCGCEFSVRMEK